jgi:hypothetical protein
MKSIASVPLRISACAGFASQARCLQGRLPSRHRPARQRFPPGCGAIRRPCAFRSARIGWRLPGRAQIFALIDPFFHGHEVDDAFQACLRHRSAAGRASVGAGPVLDHADAVEEVGAGLVHLVDEHDPRNLVAVGLTPDGFGLRLDPCVAVQQHDSAVQHGQRTLDLNGEVHVAGGVDDVEAELVRLVDAVARIHLRCQKVVVAAEVMVMPRSCSCSIQSIVAAPSWTSPILWDLPV